SIVNLSKNIDEFVLLYDHYRSKNPDFSYEDSSRFDFDKLEEAECKADFRVEKRDLHVLANALQIPPSFQTYQRSVADGLEGLCMLMKRFTYPCRYGDTIPLFGRPVPELSMITNHVMNYVYDTHCQRITEWNNNLLSPDLLEVFARAIHQKGAPLQNCFGSIDGTVRPICRPRQNQRVVYNGHKKVHALKFQSVVVPNGMIANLYGPVEGKRHDAGMLAESGLLQTLEAFSTSGQPMCLYGDPAYPLRVHSQAPFREANLTNRMQLFNTHMSATRVSVEWLFGDIINYFKFLDFKKNLKIGLSSIGKMYVVCALLRNALTCICRASPLTTHIPSLLLITLTSVSGFIPFQQ
ncbi:Hypothetical predicted protein, partial [Paramuricea clavata]